MEQAPFWDGSRKENLGILMATTAGSYLLGLEKWAFNGTVRS
jgi:hypothetical protein